MKEKQRPIVLFFLFWLLCGANGIYASHIVGGDAIYKLDSYNADSTLVNFDIEYIIYRDTAGIAYDQLAQFSIFRRTANRDWELYDAVLNIPLGSVNEINAFDDPCKDEILSNRIIESGTYNFRVTLDVGEYDYMIAYQKCCRNYTINNIFSEFVGSVYDLIITSEAIQTGNNSPVFKDFPPIYVCNLEDFDFDHSATDVDGDSLVYVFCTPLISGVNQPNAPPICCDCIDPDPYTCLPPFDEVSYTDFYTKQNPVGGDPIISINESSGMITGSPNILGAFLAGICVEEYRDGRLIGSYRRDFQFNVEFCTPRIIANLSAPEKIVDPENVFSSEVYNYKQCERAIEITNLSTDPSLITDYKWTIIDTSNAVIFQSSGAVQTDLVFEFPRTGVYHGTMVINDTQKCVDTAFFRIEILPVVNLAFDASIDPCQSVAVPLKNNSEYDPINTTISWSWWFEGVMFSETKNAVISFPTPGVYEVTLMATDQYGCASIFTKEIVYDYYDEPVQEEREFITICAGDSVLFNDSMVGEAGIYEQIYLTEVEGCDSLRYTLSVDFFPEPDTLVIDTSICNGVFYYFNNQDLSESGTFMTSTSFNLADCDSLITILNLEVSLFPISVTEDTILCDGDSLLFFSRWISESGIYNKSIKSTKNACDSFDVTLNLAILPPLKEARFDTLICEGDTIAYNESLFYQTARFKDNYSNVNGCDSLERLVNIVVDDALELIIVCEDSIRPYLDYKIEAELNKEIERIEWIPAGGLSCTDCLAPTVNISEDQTYTVTIWDDLGCSITKDVTLYVDPLIDFYVPNVIAKKPVNHPTNEYFFLQCDFDYNITYDLHIYDRWGSLVGQSLNVTTNEREEGWTPEEYLPGIYIYKIDIKDDVLPKRLVGDLTVIK